MKKTIDEIMKEPELAREPEALREIHAIRLKLYEERKGMTPAEYNAIVRQRATAFLASDYPQSPSGKRLIDKFNTGKD